MHGRQSETGAILLGSEEGIEELLFYFGQKTRTTVLDANGDRIRIGMEADDTNPVEGFGGIDD